MQHDGNYSNDSRIARSLLQQARTCSSKTATVTDDKAGQMTRQDRQKRKKEPAYLEKASGMQ